MFDKTGRKVVYTGGSCQYPGTPDAHAGIGVWFGSYHKLLENFGASVQGRQTSNAAHIQAATYALRVARERGFRSVNIWTQSELVVKAVYEYFDIWEENNWKNLRGKRVVNYDDWIVLLNEIRSMDNVKFTFVWNPQNKGSHMARNIARKHAASYIC